MIGEDGQINTPPKISAGWGITGASTTSLFEMTVAFSPHPIFCVAGRMIPAIRNYRAFIPGRDRSPCLHLALPGHTLESLSCLWFSFDSPDHPKRRAQFPVNPGPAEPFRVSPPEAVVYSKGVNILVNWL
jgi:hypothetical protein